MNFSIFATMFYRDLFHLLYVLQHIKLPGFLKVLERSRYDIYVLIQMQIFCMILIVTSLDFIVEKYALPKEWTNGWLFFTLTGLSLVLNFWLMYFKKNSWFSCPAEITNWSLVRGAILATGLFIFAYYQFSDREFLRFLRI